MEDVVDCLSVFSRIAYLVLDDSCFIHQQIMIDVNMFRSQVEGVSSKVVQFVHVYAIFAIAYDVVLPWTKAVWIFPVDQGFHSEDLFRCDIVLR